MKPIKEPPKVSSLLERQGALLEIRRRVEKERNASERRGLAFADQGPWITVSRTLGTEWEAVTRRVATHLGWHLYDREILEQIAHETRTREGILSLVDEREVGWIEDTLARLALPDHVGRHEFLERMARVILALGRRGRSILVGRGANWLLHPECGLRVRMIAPLPMRVDHVAEAEGLTLDKALARIQEDDATRARFIRQVYRKDIQDPAGYDLILNLGSLMPEPAADCIVAAAHRKLDDTASRVH
jgi:cytidylate kinase